MKDAPIELLRKCPPIRERIEKVKIFRLSSGRAATNKLATTPYLFGEDRQPTTPYLFIPKVSSERRPLMPLGFMQAEVIANGSGLVVAQADLYTFGVLQSTMHMAWMRRICGRMKSDYQYSASLVYNNYPWPDAAGHALSDKRRQAIETAAQAVLDARAQFPTSSLADLYDPVSMPLALLKAHQKLDAAVDSAYQTAGGQKAWPHDAERVAFLFALYQRATDLMAPATPKRRTPRSASPTA